MAPRETLGFCSLLDKWKLLDTLVLHPDATAARIIVACKLLGRLNNEDGRCFPSLDTIAEDCRLHKRNVIRALAWLQEINFMRVTDRGGGTGKSNHYAFNFDFAAPPQTVSPAPPFDGANSVTSATVQPLETVAQNVPNSGAGGLNSGAGGIGTVSPAPPKLFNLNSSKEHGNQHGNSVSDETGVPPPVDEGKERRKNILAIEAIRRRLIAFGVNKRGAKDITELWPPELRGELIALQRRGALKSTELLQHVMQALGTYWLPQHAENLFPKAKRVEAFKAAMGPAP